MSMKKKPVFKTCPMCGEDWLSRDSFLDDATLNFNGYQPNFGTVEDGIFYFTHETSQCGSTMALKAKIFISLFNGRKYQDNKQQSKECTGRCLNHNNLERCPAQCRFAFVREVSEIIKDRSHRLQ